MPGMPDPVETSASNGGSAKFFKHIERWLNGPNQTEAQSSCGADCRRCGTSPASAPMTTSRDLSRRRWRATQGINHFNKHWRGGSSGWWPNITRDESQLGDGARLSASALHPANINRNIRLRWDLQQHQRERWQLGLLRGGAISAIPARSGSRSPRRVRHEAAHRSTPNRSNRTMASRCPTWRTGRSARSRSSDTRWSPTTTASRAATLRSTTSTRPSCHDRGLSRVVVVLSAPRARRERIPGAHRAQLHARFMATCARHRSRRSLRSSRIRPYTGRPGYLLWDADAQQGYRVIALPRGVTVLAVTQEINVNDELHGAGLRRRSRLERSPDGGIVSNPILAGLANTVHFESRMTIANDGSSFTYTDTARQTREQLDVEHVDENTLERI